jgi:formamidopyrimidine-DNA glycosylase
MLEIPEAYVLAEQAKKVLTGKKILRAAANSHPHAFAAYSGDPDSYGRMLAGKVASGASFGLDKTCGCHVKIICGDYTVAVNASIRYYGPGEAPASKHQLLIEFDDNSCVCCTVQIWGSLLCYPAGGADISGSDMRAPIPSPLVDAFELGFFLNLFDAARPALSVKACLTSEQRLPGLGNGVMHDILYNARIHPKRKIGAIDGANRERLFHSVKATIRYMAERGGRDTQKDLYGNPGGYKTILSSRTAGMPCRTCGSRIIKEMYLGGNIYYCPACQQ